MLGMPLLALAGQTGSGPVNLGFEASPPASGWELNVYGAQPRIERDTQTVHEGRSAIRISSESPSDTALGQEVRLTPGRAYALRGWVRTRGLDARGAPVYGAIQVQLPGGRGVLASGSNHGGDTDWTSTSATFVAPSDGRVRLCVFFVGFGKGVGSAWFDGLELKLLDLSKLPITPTREPLVNAKISPYQYGQFIEYLCDLVPSMWAEKLSDGSFEGSMPYKLVYLKETDFKERPWVPWGATNRAEFARDKSTKVSGEVSERITVEAGPRCTVGIRQSGIAATKGEQLAFSCWLRQDGLHSNVRVALNKSGRTLCAIEFTPSSRGDWAKHSAPLTPSETVTDATLVISFHGPGTLWIDNVSLMPVKTVGGWRPDVVEAVKALKPGIIRFGGSALDDPNLGHFQWRETVGDVDKRVPFRAWGGIQPQGAGLEEIVQFCYAVGAEPLICVPFSRSSPQDASDEVQYFNGAPNTPMGALRARNGRAKPYGIKFWQVGNERGGADYEARLPDFCAAMRRADPAIRILSSYPSAGVLRGSSALLDCVCPHQYDCADLANCQNELTATKRLILAGAPGRTIRVGVTEWNTTAGDAGPRRAMLWTLQNALACSRYHNLLHRNCDLVEIANRSNLINSFCSGIIQTDNHRLYKTPTYYAQQLYSTLAGVRPLRLDGDVPPELGPDISATLSGDGKELTIFAVNISDREITRPIDLSRFDLQADNVEVWTLADRDRPAEPDATNSFDDPERIRPVHATHAARPGLASYSFPAYSLTVLRWKVNSK
jgi:alpha-N-arabinofuranosidase